MIRLRQEFATAVPVALQGCHLLSSVVTLEECDTTRHPKSPKRNGKVNRRQQRQSACTVVATKTSLFRLFLAAKTNHLARS